ncbi:ParA family protein [Photobacterium chitinilyticum]|uniref:ParA family protein n=1 Tax=Photobacterium chitinilyticum TaxID=2485123 RepID=A0A3S3UHX2_9GAMM|nr:ParA family protein [Photobacterium chitinilyticum]RWX52843.1 ParA family protein [Photobacterium chitinilyticum]
MTEVERLKQIASNMQQEQLSRKELIAQQTSVSVSDDEVDGMDRLVYNHCLNKKAFREFTRLAPVTFQNRVQQAIDDGVIPEPIYQNKQHLYTRTHIHTLLDHWEMPTYRDNYEPRVVAVENQKGGTGKSTTSALMAVAAALDLDTNARVLLIDLDPQGTLGQGMISGQVDEDSIYLTTVDIILGKFESEGEYASLRNAGYTDRDIILNATFNTHLPNLDVMPAFSTDERFHDLFWQAESEEVKVQMINRLATEVIPVLKEQYDLIIIDTPPQESPLIWVANEALEFLLITMSPREYDYASTTNYLLTTSTRFSSLPSEGKNLLWSRVLVVNHDEKSKPERDTIDKLSRTVQDRLLSSYIVHSELIVAASSLNRTALDVAKAEKRVSARKYDETNHSVNAVYRQVIREIKANSTKQVNS